MLLRNDYRLYLLHGVISQKVEDFIISAVRTTNSTQFLYTFLKRRVLIYRPTSVALRPQFTNNYHLYNV
jgi:hypothetical protein